MPVRGRRPEDEKPLFRALNEQRLIRPVGAEQNGAAQAQASASAGTEQAASAQAGGAPQAEQGPIARALGNAQQNNWVYPSVANTLRQTGLVDKADALLSRLTGR